MRRLVCLTAFCAVLVPALAFGQTSVTVLGLRSATADEDVANQLTDALRQAAESASSSTLRHTGRENALSQLLTVFDCEEPTDSCMQDIGQSLNSDRLVYGLVEPESGRADANYIVSLKYFNVQRGVVERDLREVIPRRMSAEQLIDPASRFYMALTGTVVRGELALRCNVAGARVLIDDQAVGTTSAEPLVLRDLEPGEVQVAVLHDDYEEYRRTVNVEAGQLNELEVTLAEAGTGVGSDIAVGGGGEGGRPGEVVEPPTRPRNLAWLGWTTLGVGVVFGGLGLWASLSVNHVQNELDAEIHQWDPEDNVCSQAANGVVRDAGHTASEIDDMCNSAGTMQILQFVFYGLALVGGGIGLWLVLRERQRNDDESTSENALRLRIEPIALQHGGALSASLNF